MAPQATTSIKAAHTLSRRPRLSLIDAAGASIFLLLASLLMLRLNKGVDFGDESTENFGLYSRLQDRLRSDVKSAVVKGVTVQ